MGSLSVYCDQVYYDVDRPPTSVRINMRILLNFSSFQFLVLRLYFSMYKLAKELSNISLSLQAVTVCFDVAFKPSCINYPLQFTTMFTTWN